MSPSHWTQLTEWVAESISLSLSHFLLSSDSCQVKRRSNEGGRGKSSKIHQNKVLLERYFSISLVIVITLVSLTSCDVMELSKL